MTDDLSTDREGFNRAGVVRLAPEIVTMVREFAEQYGARPGGARVVSFDWSAVTTVKEKGESTWRELGPSICVGAYERRQVPDRAIHRQDGVAFATKIPPEILAGATQRLIVRDDGAPFEIALI